MKQLTMTKVLTPIAALAFAFGVQAAAPGDPEGFESYSAGASVTNATGWSFSYGTDLADDASVVTEYGAASKPSNLPDAFSDAGDKYLKLSTEDGTLFRNMDGDSGATVPLYAGLFVDTDVQFTITDPSDRPEPKDGDKFIIWLEDQTTATNLCACALNLADGGVVTTNVYTLVDSNGDSLGIVPGTWYRLTVKAIADANGSGTALPGFQVYLNGQLVKTLTLVATGSSYNGLSSATKTLVDAQTFLPAMATTMSSLSKVGFSGEGAVDNIAVTRDVPYGGVAVQITWDTTVIDTVEMKTADGVNAFAETLTTSPVTLKVNSGAQFKLVPNYKSGYTSSTHSIGYAAGSGSAATIDGSGVVTATGAGAVEVTTTPLDTVKVSFDFTQFIADLTTLGVEAQTAFQSAVFKVNGTTLETLDIDDIGDLEGYVYEVTNLKPGTNVTVEVTFSPASWAAALDITGYTDYLELDGMKVTVVDRPNDGATTVNISAGAAGPAVPEITPSASGETGATYTSAQADDIVTAINNNKSTYIKAPTGITDATYASKFVASKVEVNGSYKIVVALTSEAKTALQTDADAKAQTLAASLSGIAAGTVTEVSATGATPGFYYMVAYDTAVGGTYATKGTAGLASDAGAVTLTVPAKASGATAGFYKIVVVVEAN